MHVNKCISGASFVSTRSCICRILIFSCSRISTSNCNKMSTSSHNRISTLNRNRTLMYGRSNTYLRHIRIGTVSHDKSTSFLLRRSNAAIGGNVPPMVQVAMAADNLLQTTAAVLVNHQLPPNFYNRQPEDQDVPMPLGEDLPAAGQVMLQPQVPVWRQAPLPPPLPRE